MVLFSLFKICCCAFICIAAKYTLNQSSQTQGCGCTERGKDVRSMYSMYLLDSLPSVNKQTGGVGGVSLSLKVSVGVCGHYFLPLFVSTSAASMQFHFFPTRWNCDMSWIWRHVTCMDNMTWSDFIVVVSIWCVCVCVHACMRMCVCVCAFMHVVVWVCMCNTYVWRVHFWYCIQKSFLTFNSYASCCFNRLY